MRAGLAQREPARVAHWERTGLYDAMQRRRAGAPAFVLHDGPPFTNADVHIGTALNKTLKDVTVRYKALRGFRTPYVPGWDCHGLPIEQKVARELRDAKRQVTTPELRQLCDAFSETWIAKQREQFKRLGVVADWANEYRTKDPAFEADILRIFAAFVDKGLVYRSKKPVYWSIPFETALAEAEVEYREHASPSVWVRFRVPAEEAARFGLPADKPLSLVIWTTTPWTLPGNLAIALNPNVEYAVADTGPERIIVAAALLGTVAKEAGLEPPPAVLRTLPGRALEHLGARHPFIDRASPVVLADYVTTDSGTGCVHTAPGHGAEDYQTGLAYGLEIYCPVGDNGAFLDDGRVPADGRPIRRRRLRADVGGDRPVPRHRPVPGRPDGARDRLDRAEHHRLGQPLGSVSVHPAQPGLLHAGRLRRAADPAGAEPAGRQGPGQHRARPGGGGPDPGRHLAGSFFVADFMKYVLHLGYSRLAES